MKNTARVNLDKHFKSELHETDADSTLCQGRDEQDYIGQWIWTSQELPPRNQFVCFRKEFDLSENPDAARLLITAERFFQLWVNGQWVGQGPALGLPAEKAYDVYDVRHLLKTGKNVIAVVVQFDGDMTRHGRWFMPHTQGGLWCQLQGRVAKKTLLVATDETWTVYPPQARDSDAPFLSDLYFQEIYTFGIDPSNWHTTDFDDSEWAKALVLCQADGTGVNGERLAWHKLIPRDIPILTRRKHLPVHVYPGEIIEIISRFEFMDQYNIATQMSLESVRPLFKASIENEGVLLNPNDRSCTLNSSDLYESHDTFDGIHVPTLILDFGHLQNSHLSFEVEGPPGATLDIGYGPDLIDGRVFPYRSTRTAWADRVILKDAGVARAYGSAENNIAEQFKWRSFFWRQFRFVQITVRHAVGPVKLRQVEAESVTHTWNNTTEFSCSDPQIEAIWKAAERTAQTCTMDIFTDTFSRESRQYTADVSQMVPATEALHGNEPLLRRYLHTITAASSQMPNDLFVNACPGNGNENEMLEPFTSGTLHIKVIWDHYNKFGDKSFLEEHASAIHKFMLFWDKLTNERGLLTAEEIRAATGCVFTTPFFDWVNLDRRGEMLLLNAFYALNLRIAEQISRLEGREDKAEDYQRRAGRICEVLKSDFWDEERSVFVDALVAGEKGQLASEHSQGLMLYLELASKDQAERLVQMWQRYPRLLTQTEATCLYYILEGLVKYGYGDFALSLLRRFNRHLAAGRETFGENWNVRGSHREGPCWLTFPSRAYAHGMAAWPVAFILEHIVGLQPRWVDSQFIVRIAPQPVLEHAKANWCGHELKWQQNSKHWEMTASFAEPVPVEFVLPFPVADVRSMHVNGVEKPVEATVTLKPCLTLEVSLALG
jgi:hypothetical protein